MFRMDSFQILLDRGFELSDTFIFVVEVPSEIIASLMLRRCAKIAAFLTEVFIAHDSSFPSPLIAARASSQSVRYFFLNFDIGLWGSANTSSRSA